jgi:hypothetical protein
MYSSLENLLGTLAGTTQRLDDRLIENAIVPAITPRASEIAADRGEYELGAVRRHTIRGFATPGPSLLAVSFEVSFDLRREVEREGREEEFYAVLTVTGDCSFNPETSVVSNVEIGAWSTNERGAGMVRGSGWQTAKSLGLA